MNDVAYSFRDVDKLVLRIFSYLQEKRRGGAALSDDEEKIFRICEGFLTSKSEDRQIPRSALLGNSFEIEIPEGEIDLGSLSNKEEE
jgi:hypothetical protein